MMKPIDLAKSVKPITAYQGGPHRVGEEGYDNSKIGTGEGAQAFGHGHYFAEAEPVAEGYRDRLSGNPTEVISTYDPENRYTPESFEEPEWQAAAKALLSYNSSKGYKDYLRKAPIEPETAVSAMKLIKNKEIIPAHAGYMHEVAIHAHPDHFLDWDKPLSEQSEHVRNAISGLKMPKGVYGENPIGGHFYGELTKKLDQGDPEILNAVKGHPNLFAEAPELASSFLHSRGIRGIRYLDANSRGATDQPTRNYVVFDPKDIEIKRRYAEGGDVEGYATKGAVMDPLELAKSVKPLQQTMPVAQQSMSNMPMMPNPVMPQHPLQKSYEAVNKTGITVSPRPGKGGGPPIIPGKGFKYDPELETDREHWTPATPNLLGTALPPPIQHPVFQEPDMEKLQDHAHRLLKNPKAMRVMQEVTGLDPKGFKIMPTYGTWKGEKEPSFILQHPDMTDDAARKGANLLGFGWQQDAAVRTQHNPAEEEGIPNVFIGHGKKFSADDVDRLTSAATKRGRDLTITPDGKAAQFSHFGKEKDYPKFLDDVNGIADETGMKHRLHAHMNGDLHNAKGYLAGIFGEGGEGEGLPASVQRSPDLFKRIVDHILKPYAQATASEGYRLSPERLQSAYGLTHDETNYVRNALYPPKSADRSSVPIMTGEEQLDVRPTGDRGQNTVGDVLYALQNRAASKGQIDTNDYSPLAMKRIAEIMAREVAYHVANSDKSAIGWYDEALKKAMAGYHTVFPELKTDKQKEMLFKAILGITSQGADVHTNSINASRLYSLIRNKNMTLPEATKQLSGSFGKETGAIENNLHKFHHLVTTNGYDAMQNIMNQTRTVSEWNKILGKSKNLYDHNGKPMDMQGGANQKVTGWTVFGPKIGSFINNLNGNFSTLTSDLWFSRTWNRMLGHNFIHSPKAEQKQYGDFRDALKAEYYHSNPNVKIGTSYKTANGKISKDANGKPEEWEYGDDATQLSHDQFTKMIDDPEEMMKYADQLHSIFKKGNYKNKSDLRRRAKSLIENRILPVAAPRGDKERDFQQNTAEEAQRMLKRQGLNISIADIQAALWFHEKELMGRFGAATEKSKPADYEDAAKNTIDMIKSNTLFKSKGKKEEPEEPLSTGGVVRRASHAGHFAKGGSIEPQETYQPMDRQGTFGASRENISGSRSAFSEGGSKTSSNQNVSSGMESVPQEGTSRVLGTGRNFTGFFSNITSGLTGAPATKEAYRPAFDISGIAPFSHEYHKHIGKFDDHIGMSIPGFREVQQGVGHAITQTLPHGGDMLDIGASEGALNKAISSLTNGRIRTVALDPNPSMHDSFHSISHVPGAEYALNAFGNKEDEGHVAWNEDPILHDKNGVPRPNPHADMPITYYKPDRKFDIAHEAMVFQFMNNNRDGQVKRAKELLHPHGILINEEKFVPGEGLSPSEFAANEAQKDAYKEQFFTKEDIAKKAAAILHGKQEEYNAEQKAKEAAVVGMHDLQVSPKSLEKTLKKYFKHVVQIWDSGNFKGYASSDNPEYLHHFVSNLPDMNSEYSTTQTPKLVNEELEHKSTGGVVRRAYMKGGKVEGSIWHGKDANVEYGAPTNSAIVQHVLAKIAAPLPATIYPQGSVTGRRQ